jgi:hypothetical protein
MVDVRQLGQSLLRAKLSHDRGRFRAAAGRAPVRPGARRGQAAVRAASVRSQRRAWSTIASRSS